MPRFPRPWSKKRGQRFAGSAEGGIAVEAAFFAGLFLLGVFTLSLTLINRFAPEKAPEVSSEAFTGGLSFWIFGVLSVAAIASGVIGLVLQLMSFGASNERRSALKSRAEALELSPRFDEHDDEKLPNVPQGRALTESPGEHERFRLAQESPQMAPLAGPAVLALLWNAVWFVLLAVVISGFWYARPRYVLAFLLVPFAGIGWWSFRLFLSQLRKFAGIGATIVEISDHPLFPDQKYNLYVSQAGRMQLKKVLVQLTCEEETFYRQGTDVRVERFEAFTVELHKERVVRVDPQSPWEQQLTLELPANAMHSFVGTHNAIRWKIVVTGESRPWPSFCRSFPVVVHPPELPLKRSPR